MKILMWLQRRPISWKSIRRSDHPCLLLYRHLVTKSWHCKCRKFYYVTTSFKMSYIHTRWNLARRCGNKNLTPNTSTINKITKIITDTLMTDGAARLCESEKQLPLFLELLAISACRDYYLFTFLFFNHQPIISTCRFHIMVSYYYFRDSFTKSHTFTGTVQMENRLMGQRDSKGQREP